MCQCQRALQLVYASERLQGRSISQAESRSAGDRTRSFSAALSVPDFVVISYCACRASNLQVSTTKSVDSVHKGGVTWLDLDGIDHRWLLAAAADASVAAYDTEACTALLFMMTFT